MSQSTSTQLHRRPCRTRVGITGRRVGGRRRARARLAMVALLALALCGLVDQRSALAACLEGGVSGNPPEPTTFLRSYRAGFRAPTRLALDAADNVYVTDPQAGMLLVRAANGRVIHRVSLGGHPVSVAVDPVGVVYVGDADSGAVTAYDAEWRALFQVGAGLSEFSFPGDIAIDPVTRRVYVADSALHRIAVYDAVGVFVTSFGGLGGDEGELDFPAGIFVDSVAGEVLVTDQLNFRLQAFDLDGVFLRCIGGSSGSPGSTFQGPRALHVPQGLWVAPTGRIYVADASEGRVRVLDPDGAQVGSIGEFGRGPGGLRIPMDVVVDSHGRVIVASSNNARLEMFGLAGFSDPESVLPALVSLHPNPLDLDATDGIVGAIVTVPGYRVGDIDPLSVRANGVVAVRVEVGDHDGDTQADLLAEFDAGDLLGPGTGTGSVTLTVTGELGTMGIEGSALLDVIAPEPLDHDGDGVPTSADVCPGTGPGEPVDAGGCSLRQLCSCGGPGTSWKNHGEYVSCVANASHDLRAAGVPQHELDAAVSEAVRSACGKSLEKVRGSGLGLLHRRLKRFAAIRFVRPRRPGHWRYPAGEGRRR